MAGAKRKNGLNGSEDTAGVSDYWHKPRISDAFLQQIQKDVDAMLRKNHADNKYRLVSDAARFLALLDKKQSQRTPATAHLLGEASSQSTAEADAYRHANEITVTGRAVPTPILRLAEFEFPYCVAEGAQALYDEPPTVLQSQCWPIALSGRDLLAVINGLRSNSQAYVIPAVTHVLGQPTPHQGDGPVALVLVPTRHSALRIQRDMAYFEESSGIRSVCLCSGDWKERQLKHLRKSSYQIWIATPSRILSFIGEGKVRLTHCCTLLVMDEVDTMLTMGFETTLRIIAYHVRSTSQTLMFAASRTRALSHLADELLEDYVEVSVGQTTTIRDVEQTVVFCKEAEKFEQLVALLEDVASDVDDKALVFAENKLVVENIARELRIRDWSAVAVHGAKTRRERQWALDGFTSGVSTVLVMTDLATVHMDDVGGGISCVVNYDIPSGGDIYVRRVSHASGMLNSGWAYTFVSGDDVCGAKELMSFLQDAGQVVPPRLHAIAKRTVSHRRSGTVRVAM